MKKLLVVVLQCILCMMLCSCGGDETGYYSERLYAYEAIAEYALDNYAATDGSRVTVNLGEITDVNLAESVLIAEEKFTYIWIENNSVVFWNDETKKLGLVYSENIKSVIKDIEEWYDNMDKAKISKNCYLIGQFNSI